MSSGLVSADYIIFFVGFVTERDLVEQDIINSDDLVMLCVNCGKKDDHFSWKCPELGTIPFGPLIEEDMICEVCGIEGEHCTDVCPKVWIPPEPKPGFRECLICCKYDDSEHWTEDCPVLANGDRKFCWNCESLGDHLSEDCPVIVKDDVNFCRCCELVGGHLTEDCPRETNDGRKYCAICKWMCSHSTEKCPLAESPEPAATSTSIVTLSKI